MKKQLFILIFLSSAVLYSSAQIIFQKTLGDTGDYAVSVHRTTDAGYIITGTTYSFGAGGADVYLIKTNDSGDTLWTKTFGGIGDDLGNSVQQTTDGGYIIAGHTQSFDTGGVYLIKTDANGDSLWTKTIGGAFSQDFAYSVQQTTDGGYIITGATANFGAGGNDVYLIKTNASGDTLWTKTFGGTGNEESHSVQQTVDGGFILCGYTNSFGTGLNDVYLIKTDANGDSLWTKTFGGTDNDFGLSIQQTTDGGYILVGETYSFGAGNDDVYLIKTDANGDSLWTKAFGGIGNDFGNSIEQTTDGGYIIGASTYSFGAGNVDVYLIKTDANGDSLWTKTFGGTAYDGLRSVQQTIDGGYIIAGYTNSFGAGIYLIKTDANGNSGCNQGNTATIITITTTQVTTTTTIVSSGGIVTIPATIVGSGGILNTLCTTVGINEITSAYSLSIYPNPTTNNFIIKLNSETKNTHLEIFNTLGEKVHSETINRQSTAINLKYPAGIYFVKVGDGEKVYVQKLIIQ